MGGVRIMYVALAQGVAVNCPGMDRAGQAGASACELSFDALAYLSRPERVALGESAIGLASDLRRASCVARSACRSRDWRRAGMITGNSGVPMAVQAMKAGVLDLTEKPVGSEELISSVERALEQSRDASKMLAWRKGATSHVAHLTIRQREIMNLVLAGHPSKNIASDLQTNNTAAIFVLCRAVLIQVSFRAKIMPAFSEQLQSFCLACFA